MEKVSADNPSVFLPFGIGALLLLALGFLLDLQGYFLALDAGHMAIPIPNNMWIPLSAVLVFSMYALGKLMIFVGRLPPLRLARNWDESERAYEFLALNANERIWAISKDNRESVKFTYGVCGIAVAVIITFVVGLLRFLLGKSQELPFAWGYSLIAILVLVVCVWSTSRANLRLVLLALRTQTAKDSPALDVMKSSAFDNNTSSP